MFKQVRSGWPKAIRSIQNSVNLGPTQFSSHWDAIVKHLPIRLAIGGSYQLKHVYITVHNIVHNIPSTLKDCKLILPIFTWTLSIPLLYVYHCYTCTIAIRVPLLYVYPFYSNCNSRHPLSKLANAGSTLSILSQNWSIVINCPKSLTSRHQATCYRLW